jgi:hypothetical protein
MTSEQLWERLLEFLNGWSTTTEPAHGRIHEAFLVYRDYELVPSATPALPVDQEDALLDELARERPEGFGRWIAADRDRSGRAELDPPSV